MEVIKEFEEEYLLYLKGVQNIAKLYRKAIKTVDYEAIQNCRDRLTVGDLVHAPGFVSGRLEYWQAKANERKECEAKRTIEYRKKVGKNKDGDKKMYSYATAMDAQNAAFLDCSEARKAEREAEKAYRLARELQDRKEQLLHTMASRLREKNL